MKDYKEGLKSFIRINAIGYAVMSFLFLVWICVCFYEMFEKWGKIE